MVSAAISVSGLEKHYGPIRAVDGLSFEVHPGEVFGILGPNGAGKTTTVEILEGYRAPDAGVVRVLDLDPVTDGDRLRPRVGVMLQEGGLYPGLKAREVLRLFAAYHDHPHDPDALLDAVGLAAAAGRYVRCLSGGQRQRLSLACALVGRPEIVFLDEPTAGMDPQARATTWDLVRDVVARGTTVVLTTHLLDEAERLCDRVAIVAAGRLAALGTPRELTTDSARAEVRFTTTAPIDLARLAVALDLGDDAIVESHSGEYRIQAAGTPALVAELAGFLRDHEVGLSALESGRQSLEAVFLQITAESESAGAETRTSGPGSAETDRVSATSEPGTAGVEA
jgi:ABC-2 type transport system ATP-binding protein